MSELANPWPTLPLADLADEMCLGKMLDKEKNRGTLQPYLRNVNVRWFSFDLNDLKEMRFEKNEETRFGLMTGDLVICEGGEPGRAAVWKGQAENAKIQKALHRVRFRIDEYNSTFALYYLYFATITDRLSAFYTGTTIKHLTGVALAKVRFPIAPLNQQARIVAKIEELFSELDAGVAALERVRASLKRYRAAVLKAAVEGKLTEDWRVQHPDTEPASALLDRILAERRRKWEEAQLAKFTEAGKQPPKGWQAKYVGPSHRDGLFELPKTWVWASSLEICDRIENGNTPPPDEMSQGSGEVPFIKVYNLTKTGFLDFNIKPTFISFETHRNLLKRSQIIPGDILFNIVGPPLGKVSLVPDYFPEWNTNQAVVLFRLSSALDKRFFIQALLCREVIDWIVRTAQATAGQFNISVANSRLLPIPLPPLAEQSELITILEQRLSIIEQAEVQVEINLKRASRLRQGILKRAFEGRLVPQDPTDEPAEQLLTRIRQRLERTGTAKGGQKLARPRKLSKQGGKAEPLFPDKGKNQGGGL